MKIKVTTTCTGTFRSFDFDVESSTTVRQLKQLLSQKVKHVTIITDEDLEKSYFNFDGNLIDSDEDKLDLYGVEDGSLLEHIEPCEEKSRNPGVIGASGMKFTDVNNEKGLVKQEWAKTAPLWRRVNGGLVLEGTCTTSKCKAEGKMVAISMNYRKFDILCDPDYVKVVCPMCKEYVEPKTCGFNNCWWRFEGMRKEVPGKPPKKYETDWKQADNAYHRFDQSVSGEVTWLRLILEVVKNKPTR